MRVLVAMSGGVDSSVAAALLVQEGHQVVGATMKLWGGASDSGCCSLSDVEDARRVAQQLGIAHHVFNFAADFEARVVDSYVAAHRLGATPNPCIECNRHLKFDRFLRRAVQLGFDAVATGHHARVERDQRGRLRLARGKDRAKDQSYVLHMLGQAELSRCRFPVGELTKTEVRDRAAALKLRTASKPDSQEVCFIPSSSAGRARFLSQRIPLTQGTISDQDGRVVGRVEAVQLVTVGQRRGLGGGGGERHYAIDVDVTAGVVTVGTEAELLTQTVAVGGLSWVDEPVTGKVLVQCSAHGDVGAGWFDGRVARFEQPQRRVAPGQSVVFYDGDYVLGGGTASS